MERVQVYILNKIHLMRGYTTCTMPGYRMEWNKVYRDILFDGLAKSCPPSSAFLLRDEASGVLDRLRELARVFVCNSARHVA